VINLYQDLEIYHFFLKQNHLIIFLFAFMLLNLGIFLISKSNLIIAPFDKAVVHCALLFKKELGSCRIVADISLLTLTLIAIFALQFNVPINLGTIFITLFTGLNIKFYNWLNIQIFRTTQDGIQH
jgi:uncharacterized membrane protein YczE